MTTARYGERKYGTFVYGTATVNRALTYSLLVDWDNDGVFDYYNEWTNALEITERRGREFVFTGTGEGFEHVQVGMLEIKLLDIDGRYDPYNSQSPLFGQLYGNQKVQLTVKDEASGNILDDFTGYIIDIRPEYGEVDTVTIYVEDGVRKLTDKKIRSSGVSTSVQYDDRITAALTAADWQDGSVIDTTLSDAMTYHWFRGNSAITEINDLTDASFGLFFVDSQGRAVYKSRVSSDVSKMSLSDADIDYYFGVQTPAPREVVKNIITVYARARREESDVEIWRIIDKPQLSTGANSPIWANFSYQGEEVPATVITSPVATTDYTANDNVDGSGTNRTADVSLLSTNFATSSKITPTLTGSFAYLTLLKIRGTVITADKYTFAQTTDTTSISTYGEREFVVKTDWLQDLNAAQEQATILLQKFKEPKVFPRIKIKRDKIDKQFGVDLFDIVTVNFTARSVTGEFRVGYIERRWSKDEGSVCDTIMHLEPNLTVSASDSWVFPTTFPTKFPV